ncbi:hypothetical protein J2853_007510 [Streptosporangium lutulentum]|uniref:Uncharacterized protein n=1 Tax=Streptosporangium lutulentum TaxID=1461250 RepID=A0ABT9QQM7_9ACTN|nr:hypothetical protein [Streptosporangium lutulentum]
MTGKEIGVIVDMILPSTSDAPEPAVPEGTGVIRLR